MSLSSLLDEVISVLKTDPRLISEGGELLKNKTQELAYKLDPLLIGLLLKNPLTKKRFFKEIEECLIFDQDAFVSFVTSKEFLPDSYTKYKNTIGLNIDGKTLNERKEISLVWAYKDCVLAWWQDKEDSKRDEVFYNETLGSDQIDRLLDPKVFTGFKRIDTDGKHDLKSFRKDENGNITDNLIIKWNNLLALHSLKKKFKGQVKLIYIDPPYNTDTDSFKYNDRFNHSTWLTFIKNRLEIARELLANDGIIFLHIDDSEQAYIKILMDEIFWRENFLNMLVIETGEVFWTKAAHINKTFVKVKDYVLVYLKNNSNKREIKPLWTKTTEVFDVHYSVYISDSLEKMTLVEYLQNIWWVKKIFDDYHTKLSINNISRMMVLNERFMNFINHEISTNIFQDQPYSRTLSDEILSQLKQNDILNYEGSFLFRTSSWSIRYYQPFSDAIHQTDDFNSEICRSTARWDLWKNFHTDMRNIDTEGWVKLKWWKKPERLLKDILTTYTSPNDLVLDFFWWSGTTGAVAHKMKRQYILTEQMEYIHDLPEQRLINVINGDKTGISESVGWEWWWDVVYMEIACNAERYIEMIRDAQNTDMLLEIWTELKIKSFVNHKLNPKSIDNTLEEFKTLSFSDQQKILIDLIDKNALYKNFSEMDDIDSGVNKEDRELNRNFYN